MNKLDFEKKILANMLTSHLKVQVCIEGSIKSFFFQHTETAKLFDIIIWHHKKYQKVLEKDSLPIVLKLGKKLSEEMKTKLIVLFEEFKDMEIVSNFHLLLDEFRNYHEFNVLSLTFKKSMDDMADNKTKAVLKRLKTNIAQLEQDVNPNALDSGFFAADAERVIAEYKDKREHPEKYVGIKVNIAELDDVTNGFEEGTVIYLMGEMKSGKSVVMANFAMNIASQGKRVYYHINEGSKRMVRDRLTSCACAIPYNNIKWGTMTPEEDERCKKYLRDQQSKKLIYLDRVSPAMSSAAYIDGKLSELEGDGKFDIVLVDMIPNMTTDNPEAKDWKKLGVIALELKSLAMKHRLPVIVLAHVNTEGMKSGSKSFGLKHAGVSKEPLKVVDLIVSWRIDKPEEFAKTNEGLATLSVQGSRDSASPPLIPIYINTNMMKIDTTLIHT